nr:hypothetical protein BaRGS_021533 [Batillaria attramentaria]
MTPTSLRVSTRVVKLSEDECVSSPVAEYWAGHEFRFKKPVTITLPHFLPPDPDPSLGPPVLTAMVCGNYMRDASAYQTAQVSVHVWDKRMNIADYREAQSVSLIV